MESCVSAYYKISVRRKNSIGNKGSRGDSLNTSRAFSLKDSLC